MNFPAELHNSVSGISSELCAHNFLSTLPRQVQPKRTGQWIEASSQEKCPSGSSLGLNQCD